MEINRRSHNQGGTRTKHRDNTPKKNNKNRTKRKQVNENNSTETKVNKTKLNYLAEKIKNERNRLIHHTKPDNNKPSLAKTSLPKEIGTNT